MKLEYLNSIYQLYQIDTPMFTVHVADGKEHEIIGDILPGVAEKEENLCKLIEGGVPRKMVIDKEDIVGYDVLHFKSLQINNKFYAYKLIGRINNQLKQV